MDILAILDIDLEEIIFSILIHGYLGVRRKMMNFLMYKYIIPIQ